MLKNGCVTPRRYAFGRIGNGKPLECDVFAGRECRGEFFWYAQREAALTVMRRSVRVAMQPTRIDSVNIFIAQIMHAAELLGIETGFLKRFARSGLCERFAVFL